MKFYDYISKAMKVKESYISKISNTNSNIEELRKALNGEVYKTDFINKQISELQLAKIEEKTKALSEINSIRQDFNEVMKYIKTPNGEHLNNDFNLLGGSIELSSDDIQEIAERNKYNLTMLRAVEKYAKDRDISYPTIKKFELSEVENKYITILNTITQGINGHTMEQITPTSEDSYYTHFLFGGHLENLIEESKGLTDELSKYVETVGIKGDANNSEGL